MIEHPYDNRQLSLHLALDYIKHESNEFGILKLAKIFYLYLCGEDEEVQKLSDLLNAQAEQKAEQKLQAQQELAQEAYNAGVYGAPLTPFGNRLGQVRQKRSL